MTTRPAPSLLSSTARALASIGKRYASPQKDHHPSRKALGEYACGISETCKRPEPSFRVSDAIASLAVSSAAFGQPQKRPSFTPRSGAAVISLYITPLLAAVADFAGGVR